MPRKRRREGSRSDAWVSGVYLAVDYWTAILLLTGQVTVTGVFFGPRGFWLSLTGPILGGVRLSGNSAAASTVLDIVDVVTALLLIVGEVTVTGPWITSASFNLVVSGPAFGVNTVPLPLLSTDTAKEFCQQFRRQVITRFVAADDGGEA